MEMHVKLMKNFTSRLSIKADNIKCDEDVRGVLLPLGEEIQTSIIFLDKILEYPGKSINHLEIYLIDLNISLHL